MKLTHLQKFIPLAKVLLLICSSRPPAAPAQHPPRPNVLWITVEDMSPLLSMYGDPLAHTPNLDRLAAEGRTYTHAFSPAPVCSTSRSSIITGMYATSTYAQNHRSTVPLPDGVRFYTSYLRDAGYYCTNRGKTDYNFPMPDDAWDENNNRAHWRNRPDPSQPFFSIFNFTTTHEARFMLNDAKFEESLSDVPRDKRVTTESIKLPPYIPDTSVTRNDWARMYDSITLMDIEVGRVLGQLEEDGLATSTLVMFYSDHGMGLPRGKRWLYDSGIHVPLIMRWPGKLEPGSRDDTLVSLMDLGPTLISLAGSPVPDHMQGRAILGDAAQPEPEFLFFTRDRMDETHDMIRAVRDQQFKYIKNFHPERPYDIYIEYLERNPTMREMRRLNKAGKLDDTQALYFKPEKPAEELYDLKSDPFEIRNLATNSAHRDRLIRMRDALKKWQIDTSDPGEKPEPESHQRQNTPRSNRNQAK